MIIFYEGIEIIASFIEMFVLYKIYGTILYRQKKGMKEKAEILLAIVGAGITQLCNHISAFSYFTILIFVLYASFSAMYIYKINYIVLFSIASFYVLCIGCFDFLILTLVSNFCGGYETFVELVSVMGIFRSVIVTGVKILWILAYLGSRKYLHRFSLKKNQTYTLLIISFLGFLGFVYLANQTFKAFDYSITSIWFFFMVFFALFLFVAYFIVESREEKMKLNFAEMRNNLLEENYKTLNEIYMSNAKLYHDLNNHLNVLYQLINEGDEKAAKEYIQEISRPIMKLSKTVWTGIDVVDVIINSKLEKMKELGITSEINVEFPQNSNILPHDICTILANLLDNAIEAVELLENRGNISLTIRKINHFLLIKVSNTCIENRDQFFDLPLTTKENKELHGWGLPSVRETVEKYNGTLKCTNSDNQFVVNIMMFFETVK